MRLEDLKAFVVLADLCSFRAAAESLNITQPALSRRIQKLEQSVATRLIERNTRRVRLTAGGVRFLEKIRPVVVDAESAIIEMRQKGRESEGLIRIACLPSIGVRMLPDVLRDMRAARPRLAFRLLDGNALDVLRMVAAGEADIGIGMRVGDRSGLTFAPLLEEPIGIVCHRDHPVAARDDLSWRDLAGHPFAYNLSDSGNWLLIMSRLEQEGLSMNWSFQVRSFYGIVALARSGLALAMAPRSFSTALGATELVFRPVSDPLIRRRVHLIEREDADRPRYLSRFVEITRRHAEAADFALRDGTPTDASGSRGRA